MMLCLLVVLGESFLEKYNPLGFKTLAYSPIFRGLLWLTFFAFFGVNFVVFLLLYIASLEGLNASCRMNCVKSFILLC